MWQKYKRQYHLLLNGMGKPEDEGRFAQTACGNQVQVNRKNIVPYVMYGGEMCEICKGVWHLCFTSVTDAKTALRNQSNITVVRRALELTTSVTLKKALESRIRKLEKQTAEPMKVSIKAASIEFTVEVED